VGNLIGLSPETLARHQRARERPVEGINSCCCRRGRIVIVEKVRGRTFRIALLVFQALWLNVIVPGHRRGMVSLPGEAPLPCHAVAAKPCCGSSHPASHDKPDHAGDPALHCGICYFAARVTPTPPIHLAPEPLRLLEVLRPEPTPARTTVAFIPSYDGRAPPRFV
jgi:hypothetical protein